MNANGRRQRQAKNGFKHLAPRQRPNYKMRDSATAAERSRKKLQAETERRARGWKG
jgi:hypothetical protein